MSWLAQLHCPSDSGGEGLKHSSYGAYTSYPPLYSSRSPYGVTRTAYHDVDAATIHGMVIRLRDIRDGASNTLQVAHFSASLNHPTVPKTWARVDRCIATGVVPMNVKESAHGYYNSTGSDHEGGAFFSFCDGSVRFLSENIDFTTFRALITRANNEIIDDEDF